MAREKAREMRKAVAVVPNGPAHRALRRWLASGIAKMAWTNEPSRVCVYQQFLMYHESNARAIKNLNAENVILNFTYW
jgi:hypothetical protein